MAILGPHFAPDTPRVLPSPILSSSPAFATPAHAAGYQAAHQAEAQRPIDLASASNPINEGKPPAVLSIILPVATLRPIAFRTFTKKHNLTLTSHALQALASFIGKHCGASWREEGLAELVLEEVARYWKRLEARVIVDTSGALQSILRQLEGCMSGGRIVVGNSAKDQSRHNGALGLHEVDSNVSMLQRQESFGMSNVELENEEDENEDRDPRKWLKVIGAFEQPRILYNASKKHFERCKKSPSFFPPPNHKTELFRQRYHIIHQRLHRNESFQMPLGIGSNFRQWRVTPIANLLGRSGSGHLLLGLITIAPAGTLAISDLTGSIHLDLSQATSIDVIDTWLCPGMIVLVDGVYEEDFNPSGGSLGNTGGIGGTVGGRFVGFSIGAPKCETRTATIGVSDTASGLGNLNISGSFGWVDFLGIGSERALGPSMRKMEQRLLRSQHSEQINSSKIVAIGACAFDNPKALSALRQILSTYCFDSREQAETRPPLAFVLYGAFASAPAMSVSAASSSAAASSTIPDSITYKEAFDAFALLLSEFPTLLRSSTWIFVPGDADPWPSAFSAGAAVPLPRQPIPDIFTSRIRRTFAAANAGFKSNEGALAGEAVWTSNPSRVSLFGPHCELVLFRDDVSGRMRRNHIPLKQRDKVTEAEMKFSDTAAQVITQPSRMIIPSAGVASKDALETTPVERIAMLDQHYQTMQSTPAHTLTKTLLDQSYLSPFPLSIRPQHWDFASPALSLYPLPTALLLCDTEIEPFALGYQGCTVINCGALTRGSLVPGERGGRATWCEYDIVHKRGVVKSCGGTSTRP